MREVKKVKKFTMTTMMDPYSHTPSLRKSSCGQADSVMDSHTTDPGFKNG